MSAEQALEAFAAAREPGVKHERFRGGSPTAVPAAGCAPVVIDEVDVVEDGRARHAGPAWTSTRRWTWTRR